MYIYIYNSKFSAPRQKTHVPKARACCDRALSTRTAALHQCLPDASP